MTKVFRIKNEFYCDLKIYDFSWVKIKALVLISSRQGLKDLCGIFWVLNNSLKIWLVDRSLTVQFEKWLPYYVGAQILMNGLSSRTAWVRECRYYSYFHDFLEFPQLHTEISPKNVENWTLLEYLINIA